MTKSNRGCGKSGNKASMARRYLNYAERLLNLKYYKAADSISSDETKSKITLMETRFRVAGKDREIRSLQDEKMIQELQLRQKYLYLHLNR
ncbi:hypothetical protein [Paraflavitalea speifideaquila]|uniref:hypothetical protein n=1 Tax=Paraflavitalea speifideaquila TaxID=3076558 RepID=UPI0028EBB588|nr:hypothetical protein [Paraflavitalea speifideiaquila]